METLAAVGSSLAEAGAGLAEAGSTAASTASSGLSSIGQSSGAIQGASTLVSVFQNMQAGLAAKRQAQTQSAYYNASADIVRSETEISVRDAELEGSQIERAAAARANEIASSTMSMIGRQRVAFAASGVDIGSGTALRVQEATDAAARRDRDTLGRDAEIGRLRTQLKINALQRQGSSQEFGLRSQGRIGVQRGAATETAQNIKALGQGLNYWADVSKRGGPAASSDTASRWTTTVEPA